MARKKSKPQDSAHVLFDVLYEDGSRSSNRRVPTDVVKGLDGDEGVKAVLAAQDQEIAEKSGRPPLSIKSFTRSKG